MSCVFAIPSSNAKLASLYNLLISETTSSFSSTALNSQSMITESASISNKASIPCVIPFASCMAIIGSPSANTKYPVLSRPDEVLLSVFRYPDVDRVAKSAAIVERTSDEPLRDSIKIPVGSSTKHSLL